MEENSLRHLGDPNGHLIMASSRYTPIFVGFTEDRTKLVMYRKHGDTTNFYIRRPTDGVLCVLRPGANIDWVADVINDRAILTITSPEWTGSAKGTRYDLVEEPDLLV